MFSSFSPRHAQPAALGDVRHENIVCHHVVYVARRFLGARITVKNGGTDTCGTIAWGKQKFVVRRSDVPSIFKVDPRNKPAPSERDKATVVAGRPKPTEAAPPSETEDRTSAPRRTAEATAIRFDERSGPPGDEKANVAAEPQGAAPPSHRRP